MKVKPQFISTHRESIFKLYRELVRLTLRLPNDKDCYLSLLKLRKKFRLHSDESNFKSIQSLINDAIKHHKVLLNKSIKNDVNSVNEKNNPPLSLSLPKSNGKIDKRLKGTIPLQTFKKVNLSHTDKPLRYHRISGLSLIRLSMPWNRDLRVLSHREIGLLREEYDLLNIQVNFKWGWISEEESKWEKLMNEPNDGWDFVEVEYNTVTKNKLMRLDKRAQEWNSVMKSVDPYVNQWIEESNKIRSENVKLLHENVNVEDEWLHRSDAHEWLYAAGLGKLKRGIINNKHNN